MAGAGLVRGGGEAGAGLGRAGAGWSGAGRGVDGTVEGGRAQYNNIFEFSGRGAQTPLPGRVWGCSGAFFFGGDFSKKVAIFGRGWRGRGGAGRGRGEGGGAGHARDRWTTGGGAFYSMHVR